MRCWNTLLIAATKQGAMVVESVLQKRYTTIIDVHLFLIQKGQILLGQRQNTGFEDGKFHLPSGHLEKDETVVHALIRESQEELGISIDPKDVVFALVSHQRVSTGRVGLFFVVQEWKGEVQNMEPEKCSKLQWFNIDNLPENIVPYAQKAIQHYIAGDVFTLYGWEKELE